MKTNTIMMVLLIILLQGCASMSIQESNKYSKMMKQGIECENVVNPTGAFFLNILPGAGDVYLAKGEYGNGGKSWVAFTVDLLLWPYSPIWASPQAAMTANTINKKACVDNKSHLLNKENMVKNRENNTIKVKKVSKTPIPMIVIGSEEYKNRYK